MLIPTPRASTGSTLLANSFTHHRLDSRSLLTPKILILSCLPRYPLLFLPHPTFSTPVTITISLFLCSSLRPPRKYTKTIHWLCSCKYRRLLSFTGPQLVVLRGSRLCFFLRVATLTRPLRVQAVDKAKSPARHLDLGFGASTFSIS